MVLADDQNLQANGNFVPLVREDVASEELGALLDSVTTTLTDENMRDMVGQVQNEQARPRRGRDRVPDRRGHPLASDDRAGRGSSRPLRVLTNRGCRVLP